MTIELSEDALEVLEDLVANTLEDASVYRAYGGRGMYGDVCLGLVANNLGELVQFVLGVQSTALELDRGDEDAQDERLARELYSFLNALEEGHLRTQQDDMGQQAIYYWPGVAVVA